MPLAAGDHFAGFAVVRQLGSGGMGEVYLVDHPRLPRYEALKIMPPAVSANVEFRQRFNREAELAAELWHPHIVSVHDRGEADGHLWITMDYVEGTDAGHFIAERYPSGLPPALAAEIIAAVADALDYAHGRGLLHRDVKPANILLSNPSAGRSGATGGIEQARGRRILLSDFGLARELEDASGLTATNMTVGSIHYSAPEQLMGRKLDGRADQYALGATAYHLLTGRPPFDDSKAAVVISHHLTTMPPPMATYRPDLAHLDPVIARALAKDPADRFATCDEFAHHLTEAVGTSAGEPSPTLVTPAATQAGPPPSLTTPPSALPTAPRSSRRGPLIAAAVIAVLLVVAGVVAIPMLTRPEGQTGTGRQSPSPATGYAEPLRDVVPDDALSYFLTDAQMSDVVGIKLVREVLSNDHLLDTAGRVEPADCVGAVVTGTEFVYGTVSYSGVHIRRYLPADGSATGYAEQTMVLTPSADGAKEVLANSLSQWQSCADDAITDTELSYTTTLGPTDDAGSMITVMGTTNAYGGSDYRCQHTLGIWSNAVVEAIVCGDGDIDGKSQTIVTEVLATTAREA